ncbi:MAG: inositol monophosphatase family protein [Planctomycetota bacterium]
MNDLTDRRDAAVEFAREAGRLTLEYFRNSELQVERKGDGSPVTEADRNAEDLLRRRIGERFPDDAILGEEFPEKPGTSGFCWVLDPIDGTKSFVHGVPLYTTLVAVMETGPDGPTEPKVGVIYAPATDEIAYAAVGHGSWYQQPGGEPIRAKASGISALGEALVLTTETPRYADSRPADAMDVINGLNADGRLARTWGDAYGYMMVAIGRAEVMLDPVLSLWDVAALKPVIEEAGGRFSDWQGTPSVHTGDAVCTNGHLHDVVISRTKGR